MADLFSLPPLVFFTPLQKFEASQLSGFPVVVQERSVTAGAVNGPAGVAMRVTVIGVMVSHLFTTQVVPLAQVAVAVADFNSTAL